MRLRKHRTAFAALALYHFVLFFPLLFMGRVISPNDVFFNSDPWAVSPHEPVQNALINDPPTSYLTLMSLLKSDHETFHWNPYVASGIPGFGSSAAAVFSPFILLPVLAFPLPWVYTGIIFLKLNVAFWLAYFWLREERLGKPAAAIGAIIIAGSGIYAVRWLWQSTNATALYPGFLWIVRRMWNGRRVRVWPVALLALAYASAGFPAAMAYGVYLAVLYALFLAVREQSIPVRRIGIALAGVAIALMIASPSLVPFVKFVQRTGYLAAREQASLKVFYPLSHWRSFIDPDRLGNTASKNWVGDHALGTLNNFVEATIYLGIAAVPLVFLAFFNRRARSRWFWLAAMLVICGSMFGAAGFPQVIGGLPGFKYSSLARMSMLLPLSAGYLASAGLGVLRRQGWRRAFAALSMTIALLAALDLAIFAGRFHPYLTPEQAEVRTTPVIAFLQSQPRPFRIAPFFNYLWPNTSELFRLEDVRSHFSSEETYRRILRRIDPTSFGGSATVITFDSRQFNFSDPLAAMLGIRYFLEQRSIDIIRWTTYAKTVPGVKETGVLKVPARAVAQRSVTVGDEPFYAIEIPATLDDLRPGALVLVTLIKSGAVVYRRGFSPDDIAATGKIYVPLRPFARAGETVLLRIQPLGADASLLRGTAAAGESGIFYGRVTTPVIFDRDYADGRLFRNLAELPRFRPSARIRRMTLEEMLRASSLDFETESVVTSAAPLPATAAGARVRLASYSPAEQRIVTESPSPFFLASSEKLTPELRVSIDGQPASPVEINGLFAGVPVPAGSHRVIFDRRLAGQGWWLLASAGVLLLAISCALRR